MPSDMVVAIAIVNMLGKLGLPSIDPLTLAGPDIPASKIKAALLYAHKMNWITVTPDRHVMLTVAGRDFYLEGQR